MTETTTGAALQVAAGFQAYVARPAPGAQSFATVLQQLANRVGISA